jgi:flagellar basal body rod protein FlgG
MSSISKIALSGMNAAQTQLDVAAHNLANLSTEGFKRQSVVQTEQTGGGVKATVTRAPAEGSALETDIVSQLQAKHSFLANLAVFKTSNKLTGALLDKTA